MEVQRHIIEQHVQDSAQEEENPLCSSEDEVKYLSFVEENNETDYVIAEIGLSSEGDEVEDDDIQITVTTTRSWTL